MKPAHRSCLAAAVSVRALAAAAVAVAAVPTPGKPNVLVILTDATADQPPLDEGIKNVLPKF